MKRYPELNGIVSDVRQTADFSDEAMSPDSFPAF